MLNKKFLLQYLLKFLLTFCVLYFGTYFIIGVTTPGGEYYNNFIAQNLNYIDWLRKLLLNSSRLLLSVFGHKSAIENIYDLRLIGGTRVHMVYSCLGIGLLSFWAAFIIANKNTLLKKIAWITGGFAVICLLNVIRVSLLLLANNFGWKLFRVVDHHTMFNITVYIFILLMIWLYDRSAKKTGTA